MGLWFGLFLVCVLLVLWGVMLADLVVCFDACGFVGICELV